MDAMSFDDFCSLESMKNVDHFRRCRASSEITELMLDGCTAFETSDKPAELYQDVLAVCKEKGFKVSEARHYWSVNGGGSGCTVFIAFTDAIKPWWAGCDAYKPLAL